MLHTHFANCSKCRLSELDGIGWERAGLVLVCRAVLRVNLVAGWDLTSDFQVPTKLLVNKEECVVLFSQRAKTQLILALG